MVRTRLLVPMFDNEGHYFDDEQHKAFEALVLTQFGGFTRTGACYGVWKDEKTGEVFRDECVCYEVAVPSILDVSRLRAIAVHAANHYRQEAMYVEVAGIAEVFKPNWRELTWKHGLVPAGQTGRVS